MATQTLRENTYPNPTAMLMASVPTGIPQHIPDAWEKGSYPCTHTAPLSSRSAPDQGEVYHGPWPPLSPQPQAGPHLCTHGPWDTMGPLLLASELPGPRNRLLRSRCGRAAADSCH